MSEGPRIALLCRGSTRDGLGHVTRTASVAAEAALAGSAEMTVIGEPFVAGLLAGQPCPWAIVDGEDEAVSRIEAQRAELIFVDMLRLSPASMARLRRLGTVVGLSPVFDRLAELDLLIHRTRALPAGLPERVARRAGLEYAIIRPACARADRQRYERALSEPRLGVAVSMGGADAGNWTLATLRALRQARAPLLLWVLLGEGYGHCYNQLVAEAAASTRHEVILARTSASMWRVLSGCALAVLAAGTVSYEAVHAGLPAVNIVADPAHAFLLEELTELGACAAAHGPMPDAATLAGEAVDRLCRDRAALMTMHDRAAGLIDGLGARRAVREALAFHAARVGPAAHGAAA